MNNKDRIRLAEAMGWKREEYMTPPIFDPLSSADDDYAVLEWMRNMPHCKMKARFIDEIVLTPGESGQWAYEIGDYARAALKVLDD